MIRVIGIGSGGHARVVIDILRLMGGMELAGLLDPEPALKGITVAGVPVLGGDELLRDFAPSSHRLFMGVGSVRADSQRRHVFERASEFGFEWVTALHPKAVVAGDVRLGRAAAIMAGAILAPGVSLGDNVIVNHGAVVDHDCRLGDHVHIAGGVRLSGAVRVGDDSHIGVGASVLQSISIGAGSTVAAGAVVIRDVPPRVTVAGVPARPMRRSSTSP